MAWASSKSGKFGFQVKFDLEGQGQSPPKTIGTLTKLFCTFCPNLVVLAWTCGDLWRGQARGWRTHTQTDTHTDRQTQATTIPEGQNWPRVKTNGSLHFFLTCCTGLKEYKDPFARSIIPWHWDDKAMIVEITPHGIQGPFLSYQNHGCWYYSKANSYGISSNGTDMIIQEYSDFNTRTVDLWQMQQLPFQYADTFLQPFLTKKY